MKFMELIMSSLNEVNLIGRLGKDPEFKTLQSGSGVVNFSLATSERWKDQSGNQQEHTEWHYITMFGKIAEIANQYLRKGSLVYIKGKIKTDKWTDNEGNERQAMKIIGSEMRMLSGKNETDSSNSQSKQIKTDNPNKSKQNDNTNYNPDDDIPF